jgi:hypothetical protein
VALFFDHGAITWLAADGVGTTYTVSGLTFQPKALMFLTMGMSSAVDAASQALDARVNIGFASSPSNRGCAQIFSEDAAGSAVCRVRANTTLIASISDAAGAAGDLDLDLINSDGFRLIVDIQLVADLRVFWFAWGGDDIVNVDVARVDEPGAAGVVSYDVANWQPSVLGDNVVFLVGIRTTVTVASTDADFCFGVATAPGAGNQFVNCSDEDIGSPSADTDGYVRGDECFALITSGGGNPDSRASFNGFDSTGFDLNWAEVSGGGIPYSFIRMVIQGGSWKAGNYSLALGTVNNTATVSGLKFRPKGAIHASSDRVESTADTSTAEAKQAIGAWSSLSSRRAMSYWSENGPTNMEIDLAIEYDGCLCFPTNAGAIDWVVDIDAINQDGFDVIVDDARSAALTDFQMFVAFGDSPRPLAIYPDSTRRPIGIVSSGMSPPNQVN